MNCVKSLLPKLKKSASVANLGANNDVVINSSISGGQELEISIVLWIDKDATNSIQGQYFFGKLILEGNKQ